MAYIVTRNKKSGYVALVEKKRVRVAGNKTSVRNVGYVCGLGTMTQSEFEEFRGWAHGITHQESRKEAVLACPRVVVTGEKEKAKVAASQQKATTVKPMRKAKTVWKSKAEVRKNYPVPGLPGYRGKTHTQMMIERKKQAAIETEMREEAQLKREGKPSKIIVEKQEIPPSKFTPEGMEFSRQSKKKLAREGVIRRRQIQ